MSETCPVVKVKPTHESQGEYVEINEADFDPAKHERFEDGKKKKRKDSDDGREPE